jgi:hypothetical protein
LESLRKLNMSFLKKKSLKWGTVIYVQNATRETENSGDTTNLPVLSYVVTTVPEKLVSLTERDWFGEIFKEQTK